MEFAVIGPGAMGCLFAAHLKRAGHGVTLIDYKKERADLINQKGIVTEGVSGEHRVRVPALVGRAPQSPDVVLICVKSPQTREAAQHLLSWIGPGVGLLTLQNGLGNMAVLGEMFGMERVFGGVTSEGATLLGPGHVRHAGTGETVIGPARGPEDLVSRLVGDFTEAGFKCRASQDVEGLIWGKLIVNVGINALCAITRLKNGRLPEIEGTRTVLEAAVAEAVSVAHAKGIRLPYADPRGRVLEVCRGTADNVASMLQDVLRHRGTEVDFINGAIVQEAKAFAIPTPVNETLAWLVRAIQDSYDLAIR